MKKIDLAKEDKQYYNAPQKPILVQFPEYLYVMIEGQGDPSGSIFALTTEALYTVAYSVKAIYKAENQDFTVAKLEGQWWVDADAKMLETPREKWQWRIMIRMPDFVTQNSVEKAVAMAIKKKPDVKQIHNVSFQALHEKQAVQIMHVGPYATESESINKMFELMKQEDLKQAGLHHEIYLSDPRKIAAEKMKTIVRYPVEGDK